jgi:asparagine synthase (glutamine-hydrolysing)
MCGILGEISFYKKINSKINFCNIRDELKTRGPDSSGYWHYKKYINFGFRRLSIIDPKARSNQPFIDPESKSCIIFNGEIYNYKEIKKKLENKGITFFTSSDTEVVLKLYLNEGISGFLKLRGMFAFAIWDQNSKKIIIYRDPLGIKPLYYIKTNSNFYFSSSVKNLLNFTKSKNININSKNEFLFLGYIVEPDTIFSEIKSLEPGTLIEISIYSRKIIKKSVTSVKDIYYDLRFSKVNPEINNFKNLLKQSIDLHNVADVKVGLLLSSGIDSTFLAKNLRIKKFEAFTISFDIFKNTKLDEIPLTKYFCKINKIKLNYKYYSVKEIVGILPDFFKYMDQPSTDGLNTYLVTKFVKSHNIKVAISGLGSDEITCGYNIFRRTKFLNFLKKFSMFKFILFFFNQNKYLRFLNIVLKSKNIFGIYLSLRSLKNHFYILSQKSIDTLIKKVNKKIPDIFLNNIYKLISFYENQVYLKNQLLRNSDWAGMANSVEVRVPYVDYFLLKQMNKENILAKWNKDYYFKNHLPGYIMRKPKTGFNIPYKEILLEFNKKNKQTYKSWQELCLTEYKNSLRT